MQQWRLVLVVGAVLFLAGCTKDVVVERGSTSPVVSPALIPTIASCMTDAKAVETAAEAYHAQIGNFPPSVSVLTTTVPSNSQNAGPWGPWLKQVPSTTHYTIFLDPQTGVVYVYPPHAHQPSSYGESHDFDTGDPARLTLRRIVIVDNIGRSFILIHS